MMITFNKKTPLYRQIYQHLRKQILSQKLLPDQMLPSTRDLCQDLAVSRTTVLEAYEQLTAEGYIYSKPGSGMFVNDKLPKNSKSGISNTATRDGKSNGHARLSRAARSVDIEFNSLVGSMPGDTYQAWQYDFRVGKVDWDEKSQNIWQRLVKASVKSASARGYTPKGDYGLRESISLHLQNIRNCRCSAENIIITNGSQQGFDILGRMLIDPGDTVVIEEPGCAGAKLAFSSLMAKIVYVNVDEEGLIISQMTQQAAEAKLVFVTPSHQFPSGHIMSLPRRLELSKWAEHHNAYIIEDDYDSEYRYGGRPIECIQSVDLYDRTIYAGTFSKVLSPTLRLGYVVLPEMLIDPFLSMKCAADGASPPLQQLALARWINEGHHHKHLRRMRIIYAERRSLMIKNLEKYFSPQQIAINSSNTGLHIILELVTIKNSQERVILDTLHEHSIAIAPISQLYRHPPKHCILGLGFAVIDKKNIESGVQLLQKILTPYLSKSP